MFADSAVPPPPVEVTGHRLSRRQMAVDHIRQVRHIPGCMQLARYDAGLLSLRVEFDDSRARQIAEQPGERALLNHPRVGRIQNDNRGAKAIQSRERIRHARIQEFELDTIGALTQPVGHAL